MSCYLSPLLSCVQALPWLPVDVNSPIGPADFHRSVLCPGLVLAASSSQLRS